MKKFSLLVLIASSMLFVACGENTKEKATSTATEAGKVATDAVAAAKDLANKANEATKAKAKEIAKITKEKADAAEEAAQKVADEAKAKAAKLAEETKIAAQKAAAEAKAEAKKLADEAKAKATKLADKTTDKAKAVADATEAKASEMSDVAKKKIADAEAPAIPAADVAAGANLFAKCAGCHGKDGKTKALGKSQVIAGQSAEALATKIKAYKAGSRNVANMGKLMQGQVKGLSDADIGTLATYISTLK